MWTGGSRSLHRSLPGAVHSSSDAPGLVGPGLGGLVADHASWRFVFIGLTPVALLCAVLTVPALRRLAKTDEASPSMATGRRSGSRCRSQRAALSCSSRCREDRGHERGFCDVYRFLRRLPNPRSRTFARSFPPLRNNAAHNRRAGVAAGSPRWGRGRRRGPDWPMVSRQTSDIGWGKLNTICWR